MRFLSMISAIVLATLVCSLHIASAEWVQSNGPWGGGIMDLAAYGDTILAGTSEGFIFRSTNRGANWSAVAKGLSQLSINKFAISGGNIYSVSYDSIYLSTDRGATWNALDTGFYEIAAFSVFNGSLFIGFEDGGTVRSADNGASWDFIETDAVNAYCMKNSALLAATTKGIFRSLNNGDNWEKVISGAVFGSLALNTNSIFAGSDSGIFRSIDTGKTWIKSTPADLIGDPYSMPIVTIGDTVLAFVSQVGIIRSTDNGLNWTEIKSGPIGLVQTLAVSDKTIFAGTYRNGVFLSTDNGDIWSSVNTGIWNTEILSLAVNGNTVFAGTSAGIFRSTDNGHRWLSIDDGGIAACSFPSLSASGSKVFAGAYENGVFLSTDNGVQWTQANNGFKNGENIFSLVTSGNAVFAGAAKGLYASTNNGATWATLEENTIQLLFAYGDNVFKDTYSGVFRSGDYGATWEKADAGIEKVTTIYSCAQIEGTLAIAGYDGTFRSSNNGQSWTRAAGSGLTDNWIFSLASSGKTLFAGSHKGYVFSSTNNGDTWTTTTSKPFGTIVSSLAANTTTVFAGTEGRGIWCMPLNELVDVKIDGMEPGIPQFEFYGINGAGRLRTISFSLTKPEQVRVAIFNFSGREIASLVNTRLEPGSHRYLWNTGNYSAGYYTVRLQAGPRTFVWSVAVVW